MTGIVNSTGARSGVIGTTDLATATFPAGHILQVVGATDATQRIVNYTGSLDVSVNTVLGVSKAITSTSANSNFFISGSIPVYTVNGKMGVGITESTQNISGLIYNPSVADNTGTDDGWLGVGLEAGYRGVIDLSFFYDPGTASASTTYTFFLIAMGYYDGGSVTTNATMTQSASSSITIMEIQG